MSSHPHHDHDDHRHDHDHHHDHHGHHHHAPPANLDAAFVIGIALNAIIVAVQVYFGIVANSLALLSDAVHNLSDVLSLVLAFAGAILARRAPSARYTYGLRRASILAALANAGLLLVAIGGIAVEAVQRFAAPEPVAAGTVTWVAAVAILGNTLTALMFMRGHGDLNVRGAFMHMVADAAVSCGVLVAALVIAATGLVWIDPAISLAISAVLLWTSWGLTRETVAMALDAVPRDVDHAAVKRYLAELPGVTEVHDLHIWALSTTETALTAHLVRPAGTLDDATLARVTRELAERFRIAHPTLQVEAGDSAHPCKLAPNTVV
jgi:cobalt-zinc-cadmium efflux system protein